jgi:hypothetical protein
VCAIGRAIVEHDQFDVGVILSEHTVDRLCEVDGMIVGGDDDSLPVVCNPAVYLASCQCGARIFTTRHPAGHSRYAGTLPLVTPRLSLSKTQFCSGVEKLKTVAGNLLSPAGERAEL